MAVLEHLRAAVGEDTRRGRRVFLVAVWSEEPLLVPQGRTVRRRGPAMGPVLRRLLPHLGAALVGGAATRVIAAVPGSRGALRRHRPLELNR